MPDLPTLDELRLALDQWAESEKERITTRLVALYETLDFDDPVLGPMYRRVLRREASLDA